MSTPVFQKDLTGLLLVDPYNDFISEGGILWPLVNEIAEAVHCVPNMLAILQAARAAGVRVFFAPHHRDRGREDEIAGWKYSHRFRTSVTNDVSLVAAATRPAAGQSSTPRWSICAGTCRIVSPSRTNRSSRGSAPSSCGMEMTTS
jgi:nicotinamidase-related amidase